jgi:2-oxoglutarate dehydrogenase E1 component
MSHPPPLPNAANLAFVERLYEDYLRDPSSISPDWQRYFSNLGNGDVHIQRRFGPSFRPFSVFNPPSGQRPHAGHGPTRFADRSTAISQDRISLLIRLYRVRGHRMAKVDPLGQPQPVLPELDPAFLGFTEPDLDALVHSDTFQYDGPLTLRELLQRLRNTYCRSIGVQYMHIDNLNVRRWLQRRMESTENHLELSRAEQLRILTRLTDAVTFEEFIRKKFVGAKSFSLEGSESLIPLLDLAFEKAAEQGIREIVVGMAHRGRLNVLANIMSKSPRQIFREFADTDWKSTPGRGDVKYHLGHESEWTAASGAKLRLSLCFNPSHLEFVDPVALGRVRARQDCCSRRSDEADGSHREVPLTSEATTAMALLIHGDAAFAGEGVVQETLNLSQLPAYSVGGTLHVVVNNQIGFTAGPEQTRSGQYATDVAKSLQIPIFHVNGEDPEAVAQVVRLGMEFRREFRRDVVIDMYGYRRLGHNESDEPSFTQPVLYRAIARRKSVREGYLEHLLKLGGITREEADEIAAKRREALEKELSRSQEENVGQASRLPQTGETPVLPLSREKLSGWLDALTELPKDFHPHPKIKKFLEARRQMARGELPLDWSAAEALAFASLASQGTRIRLTGQDTERGTFSQRHAVLHDYQDGHAYFPFQNLARVWGRLSSLPVGATFQSPASDTGLESPVNRQTGKSSLHENADGQAPVEIYNSPLTETGVLGFEYGFSLDCPDGLTLWEAQFGDFWNAAQPIVDQFIASAEDKWQQRSGLVMLLPHGFEGQGPEHSSARLERFLFLGAEENIQIVYPTTPAQYFHCLRRQALGPFRKPLIVMTPKSLLRDPKVVSTLDECATGTFQNIFPDPLATPPDRIRRILLCTGKIYFELDEHRASAHRDDVAIVRLEQLYPLTRETLTAALSRYPQGTPVHWVQEEPANMGALNYLKIQFGDTVLSPFQGIARAASATPASGSHKRHKQEQAEIIKRAFGEQAGK